MPQLNPTPWFHIFMLLWMCSITFLPLKIISHVHPEALVSQEENMFLEFPWLWLWM